ncbi:MULTISPECIES: LysM peptidoglycan-binding domain-containing protein [unclassified Bosea (in: a-proteobacteria)]|uniref:LysM peptidoglycan-binding domain-containing protein n=1 Tax=unclassified Bosea (in: a-proteobacteria) TaxID=2653178 RepID=UPI0008568E2F|nr:hypothetical protein [Bosea sp. RAC05]AOG04422.1 hypothetical protein BSY19_4157 [Bosea sp. RAC05]
MGMRSVDSFFTDPKEKELALLVWEKGKHELAKGWTATPVTNAFLAVEKTPNVRILVTASDWISQTRAEGQDWAIEDVNLKLGKPDGYFNRDACANVEHVYRAAYLSVVLTPAASFLAAGAYEMVFDPFIKEPLMRAKRAYDTNNGSDAFLAVWRQLSAFGIASRLPDSFKRNGSQFLYIDLKGWMMAAEYWDALATDPSNYGEHAPEFDAKAQIRKLKLGIEAVKASFDAQKARKPPPEAVTNPADFMANTPPTKAGVMLSQISKERYGTFELWPLIWKYNYKAIGNNPNRVPVGTVLKIKKKEKYTSEELKFARENWRSWAAWK